jgi:hypothetical protein
MLPQTASWVSLSARFAAVAGGVRQNGRPPRTQRLVRSNVGGGLRKVFTDKFCPSIDPESIRLDSSPNSTSQKGVEVAAEKVSRGPQTWLVFRVTSEGGLTCIRLPPSPAREAPRRAQQCNGCLSCRLAELRTPIRSCVLGETAGSWRVGRRRCGSLRSPTEPPLEDCRSGSA